MNIPFAQTHFDSAVALYRQREGWLARPDNDARALARLEQRLRLHLHVISRCGRQWPEPTKAPDTFVWLTAGLSSPDGDVVEQARAQALTWLGEDDPKGEGAFGALSLFPPPAEPEQALALYREKVDRRPLLFQLWREQGISIPAALLNLADLQNADVSLQRAALAYAAERPEVGLEMFQAVYHPFCGWRPSSSVSPEVLAPALRGGLLRGDSEMPEALRFAVEICSDPQVSHGLLRLGALSGDKSFYPILRGYFERDPRRGAPLLALHGSAEAADDLVASLGRITAAEAAANGWCQLTGEKLPQRQRLQVVGDKTDTSDVSEPLPDREPAIRWREEHRAWDAAERIYTGQPLTPTNLLNQLDRRAGAERTDLLDLLAVKLRRPLGFSGRTWLAWQDRALKKLIETSPQGATADRRKG